MTRIRVTPEELFRAAQLMAEIGKRISQAASDLSNVLNGLDRRAYDGQLFSKVEGFVHSAMSAVATPAGNTGNHSKYLNERGQAFASADSKIVSCPMPPACMIPPTDTANSTPSKAGFFQSPIDGGKLRPTAYYGFGNPYGNGAMGGYLHPGVDIGGAEGTPIHPVGAGTVYEIGYQENGYGNYVIVEHELENGEKIYSIYAHLQEKPSAQKGDKVGGNTIIGKMGMTGGAKAGGIVHLHLEIRRESAVKPWRGFPSVGDIDYRNYWLDPSDVIGNPEYKVKQSNLDTSNLALGPSSEVNPSAQLRR